MQKTLKKAVFKRFEVFYFEKINIILNSTVLTFINSKTTGISLLVAILNAIFIFFCALTLDDVLFDVIDVGHISSYQH